MENLFPNPPKRIPKKVLSWLCSLPKGSIMSQKTFNRIYREALSRYGSKSRAKAVAGKAYWNAVLSRYKEAHKNPPLSWEESMGNLHEIDTLLSFVLSYVEADPVFPYPLKEKLRRTKQLVSQTKNYLVESHGHDFMLNPPVTEIYRNVIEIRAEKADGRKYYHRFPKGAGIYGLPDGSLLIKSRLQKKLWKLFPKGE